MFCWAQFELFEFFALLWVILLAPLGNFLAQAFFEISGLISMQFSMGYPNLKSDFW
jgi:hypothetical protein